MPLLHQTPLLLRIYRWRKAFFLFLIEWAHGLCYLFSWVILLLQMISHEYREKQQQCSEKKGKKSVLKRQRVRGLRGHKPNTVRLNNRIFTCPCTQTETTWCILLDSSIYCGRQRYTHIYAHTHTDTSWYRLICTLHRASFLHMCVSVLLENLWPACISLVVLSALNLS